MLPPIAPPTTADVINRLALQLGPLPDGVRALLTAARGRSLAAGEALLQAGDHWSALFVVHSGALRLYYLDRQGRASNKNFHLDGALLWPITPTLAQQPVDFWVEALVPTQLWTLPIAAWQQACADWPAWQVLERRVLAALLDDKMAREQQFLQLTATERYERLCAQRPEWLARIPLRHLASYLGITDVALSRIRRRLNPG